MDRRQRHAILTEAAEFDRDARLTLPARITNQVGLSGVRMPGGGSTTLMRIMQTNACSLSCGYCPTFCGGKVKRATLAPEEAATTFMEAHRKGLAQGLFLTSGVPGRAVRATDRMLATLEILRDREHFDGYVHIKLLPGAEAAQVEAAARWANRISVNLEAPSDAQVRILAKEKDLSGDLLPKLELRARHTLRVYDEYMAAAARHLAAQADHNVITAAQLADGINQGWTWMVEQMRADAVLLMDQVRVATEADARRWETFNTIAAGLAQVLTTAIIAGAVVNANAPPPAAPALSMPTYCQATPGMRNTITGRLMSVNVYCR